MSTAPYTTADVASILGFKPKTIRDWCARGIFPGAAKLPDDSPRSQWRIPASDVERFKRRRVEKQAIPNDRLDELMKAVRGKV